MTESSQIGIGFRSQSNSDFIEFWELYTKKLLKVLARSKYEMNDAPVRSFVRRQSFPPLAFIDEMYPKANQSSINSTKCTLFHRCLQNHVKKHTLMDDIKIKFKPCLSEESISACAPNTTAFRVIRHQSNY